MPDSTPGKRLRPITGTIRGWATLAGAIALGWGVSAQASVFTGYLTVNNASTYVSKTFNGFGEYVVTTNLADALQVSFDPSTARFAITETNNPGSAAYPFFGAIQGFASSANLSAGSYNYTYLGGTTATPSGATPTIAPNSFTASTGIPEGIESAIWALTGSVLSAQWINTDGSSPRTYLVTAVAAGNELVLTGDPAVFFATFGAGTIDTLSFVCTSRDGCPTAAAVPEPSTIALLALPLVMGGLLRGRRSRRTRSA